MRLLIPGPQASQGLSASGSMTNGVLVQGWTSRVDAVVLLNEGFVEEEDALSAAELVGVS